MSFLDWLLNGKSKHKEIHAEAKREKTNEVLDQIRRDVVRVNRQNRERKNEILKILSDSNSDLEAIADKIARAAGR